MIYAIRLGSRASFAPKEQWIDFRGDGVRPAELPTPTTSLAVAEAALAMCSPEWNCEIVKLIIHWRKAQ